MPFVLSYLQICSYLADKASTPLKETVYIGTVVINASMLSPDSVITPATFVSSKSRLNSTASSSVTISLIEITTLIVSPGFAVSGTVISRTKAASAVVSLAAKAFVTKHTLSIAKMRIALTNFFIKQYSLVFLNGYEILILQTRILNLYHTISH